MRPAAVLGSIFGIDPRSLAALRIGLGLSLLADLVLRARHLSTFYTDAGVMPRGLVEAWYREHPLSLHALGGSFGYELLLFLAAGTVALLLALGLWTRLATLVSWVLLTSLQLRNPYVGDFGDEILRIVLFWAIFLPLGRRWSIDALRRPAVESERDPVLSVASVAILCQVVIVYFVGALLKSGPDWHGDATALYYALSQDWAVKPLGLLLARSRGLMEWTTRLVLVFEYASPLLLLAPASWGRWRTFGVVALWTFHAGLAFSISLGIFPWMLCAALSVFLPAWFWDRLTNARSIAGAAPGVRSDRPRIVRGGRLAVTAVTAALFVWVLIANAAGVANVALPSWFSRIGETVRLDQGWVMYAPIVPRADGWFVMPGRLADGTFVDLSDLGPELSWDKPRLLSATHRSWRWAIYVLRLRTVSWGPQRERFSTWLCRSWNREHDGDERVREVAIFFVDETTPPAYRAPEPLPVQLSKTRCP